MPIIEPYVEEVDNEYKVRQEAEDFKKKGNDLYAEKKFLLFLLYPSFVFVFVVFQNMFFLCFSFCYFFYFIRFDEAKEEYGKAIEIVIEQLKELSLKEEKGKNEENEKEKEKEKETEKEKEKETEKEKESSKEQQKQKEDKIPNEIEKFAAICYANRAACFLTKEKFLLFNLFLYDKHLLFNSSFILFVCLFGWFCFFSYLCF